MEACIEENVCAFVGQNLHRISRQPTLNGFRPDLVFENEQRKPIIIEIQQRALDRYHLYKSLEYRDHWHEARGQLPKIILICEEINARHVPLTKTHRVEVLVFSRDHFIDIAVKSCPNSVIAALSNSTSSQTTSFDAAPAAPRRASKLEFKPRGWADYRKPLAFLEHIYTELVRLHTSLEKLPREWYRHIFFETEMFIGSGIQEALKSVADFSEWNISRLLMNDSKLLRKPEIEIASHITSKGNLSVIWRPKGHGMLSGETDWKLFNEHAWGWERPPNELMFIHDVGSLHPGTENYADWDDRVNWPVLDEIFIGLVRSAFNYLVDCLKPVCAVTLLTDFEFDCEPDSASENEWDTKQRIKRWRIYNLEERRREEDEKWFSSFGAQYGLSPEEFIKCYKQAVAEPRRAAHNFIRHMVSDLAKQGIKLKPGQVKNAHDRLRKFHWLWAGDNADGAAGHRR